MFYNNTNGVIIRGYNCNMVIWMEPSQINAMTQECYPQIKTTIIPIIPEVTPTTYNVSNI